MKRDFTPKMSLAFPGWPSPRPSLFDQRTPGPRRGPGYWAQTSSTVSLLIKLGVCGQRRR